jgi:PiT family inorganic phosphate transporter
LLPVELIMQVGSEAGFAMVFAMLIAAIIWNLGTWWLGLPASSSHTLIGSIIGVGVANALMRGRDGTSGVDWNKAVEIGYALLLSPVVGFCFAAGLLLIMKFLVRKPELYAEPKVAGAPPLWIRGLLIFTSAGVSFAHGSNDGQKGMGLIILILIGTVPTAYALNRALPESQVETFIQTSLAASKVVETKAAGYNVLGDPRPAVTNYITTHQINEGTYPSLALLIRDIAKQLQSYGSLAKIPAEAVGNTRNDMYLTSEAIRFLQKDKESDLSKAEIATLGAYKKGLDGATKFIPDWVKFSVALALGLGTMIGWKRIVITVGEKIGKQHMTYGQGAAAVWPAGFDDTCAFLGRRGHDGRQWLRCTNVDVAQPCAGMGANPTLRNRSVRVPLLCVQPSVLRRIPRITLQFAGRLEPHREAATICPIRRQTPQPLLTRQRPGHW